MKHLDNDDFRIAHLGWLILNEGHPTYVERVSIYEAIVKWEGIMPRKTYRIELKIDFNDDNNHEVMLGIAKQYARDLLGSAMLLQDGRKPAVALMTDDSFHGVDEIDLMDQSQTLHAE